MADTASKQRADDCCTAPRPFRRSRREHQPGGEPVARSGSTCYLGKRRGARAHLPLDRQEFVQLLLHFVRPLLRLPPPASATRPHASALRPPDAALPSTERPAFALSRSDPTCRNRSEFNRDNRMRNCWRGESRGAARLADLPGAMQGVRRRGTCRQAGSSAAPSFMRASSFLSRLKTRFTAANSLRRSSALMPAIS